MWNKAFISGNIKWKENSYYSKETTYLYIGKKKIDHTSSVLFLTLPKSSSPSPFIVYSIILV